MTQREFISRPHFCTDEGSRLRGYYNDEGCEVIPASGAAGGMPRRTTAARDAAAELHREAEIIKLTAKMDRLIELVAKRVKTKDAAPPLPGPGLDPGLTAGQMAAQYRREYERRAAQICAEAKAAYDARNPHKKRGRNCGLL